MPRASIYSSFLSPIIKVVINQDTTYTFKSDEDPDVVYDTIVKNHPTLSIKVIKKISNFFENEHCEVSDNDDEQILF